jgi:ferredoxin
MLRQVARVPLSRARRGLPAPSAAWDPSRKVGETPTVHASTIGLVVHLPEDATLTPRAEVGSTLLEALEASDLSDLWEGGACGGACSCSTCRVIVVHAPSPLPPRDEDEEDMLDGAAAAAKHLDESADTDTTFLSATSRLACQIVLRAEDEGLTIALPDDVTNMLEVPLWLRNR